MSQALRQLNYDGVFIYKHGHAMETMRVIHKANGEGTQERLVSLSGAPREVLRDNQSVTCIFPDKKLVMVEKSRSVHMLKEHLPDAVKEISDYYQLAVVGHARIAGHDAWSIRISPIDQYRYGYQLWVAEESKLLLKSTLVDKAGQALEEIVFTKLDVRADIPEQDLQTPVEMTHFTWKHSADRLHIDKQQRIPWRLAWLPVGFQVRSYEKSTISPQATSEHIVLTDGLAIVSVFIERAPARDNMSGAEKAGAVNAFARRMDGHTVTAIGEVPQTTVQRIASSIVSLR